MAQRLGNCLSDLDSTTTRLAYPRPRPRLWCPRPRPRLKTYWEVH